MAKGTICPLQNLPRKVHMKRFSSKVHMKRFSSVQKLQAKTERGKCSSSHPVIPHCPFIVHSKSCFSHALLNMHISCSTKRSEHVSHRKRVRTIESFFASNQSQTESEENDTDDEQCINQEETNEDQIKPKKS